MSKSSVRPVIRLRGVRHNNLKHFDLDLPLNQLIVVTGLSGSGKSSLAFDTLYAEGQRRYLETFSPYARQFFDRMDKPQVDSIEGIPPAIAIEQRNSVRTTRSTVGTMTDICEYMKSLWPHVARLHCRQCGQPVRRESPRDVWEAVIADFGFRIAEGQQTEVREVLITFDVALSEKLSIEDSLDLVAKQGYRRILVEGEIVTLDDARSHSAIRNPQSALTIVQDRLKLLPANRARFVEACEQAYHFGKGKLAVHFLHSAELRSNEPLNEKNGRRASNSKLKTQDSKLFSSRFHCAACDIEYREPIPALFSFNHPVGACPACKGFGRIISIDYSLAMPDRSLTLAQGVVRPWRTGFSAECQSDLMKFCRVREIPVNVPFAELSEEHQRWVIEGDKDYGKDEEHEWPRAWYGVKGYFRWLESKSYKMHVRVLLSRYRAYTRCPECQGTRFQPETLLYRFTNDDLPFTSRGKDQAREPSESSYIVNRKSYITLADFYALPVRDALAVISRLAQQRRNENSASASAKDPVTLVLSEVQSRLHYLNEIGLGYLTLDRPTRSLSGGETERVNLTTCLGTRLVNTLFVLDEPSVGLHPRDTERLVHLLEQLRDAGNTVVVVEHEASVMRAADQIIDLGPGHGAAGGQLVFQGEFAKLLDSPDSLTGLYLSGRKQVEISARRPVALDGTARRTRPGSPRPVVGESHPTPTLRLTRASRHNLRDVSVRIPLGRFVCVTGVSGSGKTTLVREVLLPALQEYLKSQISNLKFENAKASDRLKDSATEESSGPEDEDSAIGHPHSALLTGWEHLGRAVLVDQSVLGKTPRSNPAVYVGAFDDIREVFAQSEAAKRRGLAASAFSFNSAQGQCERCRGAGFEKVEMQFLSDVFIRCPDCGGRRYRKHILEVNVESRRSKVESRTNDPLRSTLDAPRSTWSWSIADMLEATVDEAIEFLAAFTDSKPARRAMGALRLLQEVGLGYLQLGQPINTLSGGESQRLKLVRHLAETAVERRASSVERSAEFSGSRPSTIDARPTLFLFDEPTTGLHFDDVRILMQVFQRLVDAGHSVVVIEHNLDVIKCADWIVDLGPGAGDEGGRIVAEGTPETVARCAESHTGRFLRELLGAPVSDPAHCDSTSERRRAGGRRSNGQLARRGKTVEVG